MEGEAIAFEEVNAELYRDGVNRKSFLRTVNIVELTLNSIHNYLGYEIELDRGDDATHKL